MARRPGAVSPARPPPAPPRPPNPSSRVPASSAPTMAARRGVRPGLAPPGVLPSPRPGGVPAPPLSRCPGGARPRRARAGPCSGPRHGSASPARGRPGPRKIEEVETKPVEVEAAVGQAIVEAGPSEPIDKQPSEIEKKAAEEEATE
eukprot:XP_020406522.1 vegetative cell wall protein gp1-like [Zea mays]